MLELHVVGSVAEFRINISKLSEGIHEYTFETESSRIDLGDRFEGPIEVHARLDKSLRQIFLQVTAQAVGAYICDRCLEGFHKHIDTAYSLVYIQDDRSTVDVHEEEVQILSADTNFIDLDEDVRQYLLLAVPQKLLCKEECLGLCPVCGINKNNARCTCEIKTTDTRWDALKKLSHN
jgi:uncharacterized protein